MSIGLDFHHFGLATRDAGQTIATLERLGYRAAEPVFDPLQNVNLAWCEHDAMPAVEVVYPSDEPGGPLEPYLADHAEMIYHLCYVAENLEEAVARVREAGIRLLPVAEPKPAILFGGKTVAFYMARGLGLIEILEDQ
jgi:methylmalonyl-CoA/ethylmalonyl-CoA epimerase